MRYADGGGLTARERAARERVVGQAADMFERDLASTEIAARLRVTPKSVRAWRRAWTVWGRAALASRGAGGAGASWTTPNSTGWSPSSTAVPPPTAGPRTALDPGPDHDADRAVVPGVLHPARGVLPAAPHRLDPASPEAAGDRTG